LQWFSITFLVYWHLDVGLLSPKSVASLFGRSVHPLILYVSWVQNDGNQFGLYLLLVLTPHIMTVMHV